MKDGYESVSTQVSDRFCRVWCLAIRARFETQILRRLLQPFTRPSVARVGCNVTHPLRVAQRGAVLYRKSIFPSICPSLSEKRSIYNILLPFYIFHFMPSALIGLFLVLLCKICRSYRLPQPLLHRVSHPPAAVNPARTIVSPLGV